MNHAVLHIKLFFFYCGNYTYCIITYNIRVTAARRARPD